MIKKFREFTLNEVSGTELVGPVGPGYGETRIQNKTLSPGNTDVIYSDLDNNFYGQDEYNDIYIEYLKRGGAPLHGFNLENLTKVLEYISEQTDR